MQAPAANASSPGFTFSIPMLPMHRQALPDRYAERLYDGEIAFTDSLIENSARPSRRRDSMRRRPSSDGRPRRKPRRAR